VVPNPVDVAGVRAAAAGSTRPLVEPYAVFVGKLEINKGADVLVRTAEQARLPWPLVVVGDGVLRETMAAEARRLGRDVRFTGWLGRHEALAWLAHASLLMFPSYGPESLSRVLLESAALGVPIAAINTGGTVDIVQHEHTGLLSSTPEELGDHVGRLVADRALAARLADRARVHVEQQFEAASVVDRIEQIYAAVAGRGTAHV